MNFIPEQKRASAKLPAMELLRNQRELLFTSNFCHAHDHIGGEFHTDAAFY